MPLRVSDGYTNGQGHYNESLSRNLVCSGMIRVTHDAAFLSDDLIASTFLFVYEFSPTTILCLRFRLTQICDLVFVIDRMHN